MDLRNILSGLWIYCRAVVTLTAPYTDASVLALKRDGQRRSLRRMKQIMQLQIKFRVSAPEEKYSSYVICPALTRDTLSPPSRCLLWLAQLPQLPNIELFNQHVIRKSTGGPGLMYSQPDCWHSLIYQKKKKSLNASAAFVRFFCERALPVSTGVL